jgi:hypothetical protein
MNTEVNAATPPVTQFPDTGFGTDVTRSSPLPLAIATAVGVAFASGVLLLGRRS